jgi:hypothetical protein
MSLVTINIVKPTDARGWIGVGCFLLVIVILGMIAFKSELLENDAFLILATAIVVTGWVNGPVGWAYQATKGGGEAAESSARIAEKAAGLEPEPTTTESKK